MPPGLWQACGSERPAVTRKSASGVTLSGDGA